MKRHILMLMLLAPMWVGCDGLKRLTGGRDSDPVVTPPPAQPHFTLLSTQSTTVPNNVHYSWSFPEMVGLNEDQIVLRVYYKQPSGSTFTEFTVNVVQFTAGTGDVTISTGDALDAITGFDGDIDIKIELYKKEV